MSRAKAVRPSVFQDIRDTFDRWVTDSKDGCELDIELRVIRIRNGIDRSIWKSVLLGALGLATYNDLQRSRLHRDLLP